MRDNFRERDDHGDASRSRSDRDPDSGPLSDREVPLAPVATSDVVNRWLDGELPEPTGLRGDAARSVEFWRRVGEETDRRKQMVTPPHVSANIMAALPGTASTRMGESWWRKPLQVSPVTAVAAAAGIFALGMLIMNALSLR
jgi:hypothetical protein